MGVIQRAIIFAIGTVSNAVLFLFHSRVILSILDTAQDLAGTGPATDALNLLPLGMQLAMGILQVGLILFLLGGIGQERAASRRPMP